MVTAGLRWVRPACRVGYLVVYVPHPHRPKERAQFSPDMSGASSSPLRRERKELHSSPVSKGRGTSSVTAAPTPVAHRELHGLQGLQAGQRSPNRGPEQRPRIGSRYSVRPHLRKNGRVTNKEAAMATLCGRKVPGTRIPSAPVTNFDSSIPSRDWTSYFVRYLIGRPRVAVPNHQH